MGVCLLVAAMEREEQQEANGHEGHAHHGGPGVAHAPADGQSAKERARRISEIKGYLDTATAKHLAAFRVFDDEQLLGCAHAEEASAAHKHQGQMRQAPDRKSVV